MEDAKTEDIPDSHRNPLDAPYHEWDVFIAYLRGAPHRRGESIGLPWHQRVYVGRGPARMADELRPKFGRKLPGKAGRSRELDIETATIAGYELCLEAFMGEGVELTPLAIKKHSVRVNGRQVKELTMLHDNAVVAVEGEMVLLFVKRWSVIPAFARFDPALMGPFGLENKLGLIGQSEAFCALMDALVVAVKTGEPILITGDTGVGKQLVAKALHQLSKYADGPFIFENVSKLTAGVAAKQLFGNRARWPHHQDPADPGLFGRARGGAVLLDEFGDIQEPMRSMLLTVLQEKTYRGADGEVEHPLDCLVLAATNVPLEQIRFDLRQRFHVVHVPPLSARREDITHLAAHIIQTARFAEDIRAKDDRNLPWVIEHVLQHPLLGNMRDLKAMVLNGLLDLGSLKHDHALAKAPAEHDDDAPVTVRRPEGREVREAVVNEDAMEITVRASLHKNRGNMSAVERELGVTRSWLRAFMKRRGIEP